MNSEWLIGIDLGGTKTEVILMSQEKGQGSEHLEHFRKRAPTPQGDYHATLQTIQSLVLEAESQAGSRGLPVGIGIPGSVSGITGRIKNGNSTWLNGQPMQSDLCALLQRPVTLSNDANCLALSEATDGAGKGYGVVFAAILGTGCGAGISVNGKILSGPNGVAGEWGHNPLAWTDQQELKQRPCFCGRNGCNETFLSGTGLSLTHKLLTCQALPAKDIVKTANKGGRAAAESLNRYFEHLARGLGAVINLLDPDVIVLGGGMSNVDQIYQEIPRRLPKHVFGGECGTPILPAAHGDSSGVRGAAWLSLSQVR